MRMFQRLTVLAVAAAAPAVHAEVLSVAPGGFEVRHLAHLAVSPDKVYAALIVPSRWWSSEHTYSQSAANLTLEAKAGGCFCEQLADGGSVEHLHTVYAAPGKMLRLRGALGPFQGMAVDGVLTFSIKATEGGSDLTLTYAIGGYSPHGFPALAKAADGMLGEQIASLKKLLGG